MQARQAMAARSSFSGARVGQQVSTVRPVQSAAPKRQALRVQALRVNNVEIPNSKRVETSLQYIFGVGQTSAQSILRDSGIENKKVFELNEEEINKLREEVGKYTTESDLRRVVAMNIKRLKDIGCYRGRRHIMGLPCRGQKTKCNARTRKGKAKTVANKKKATR